MLTCLLDYGNATSAGMASTQLQSVMNAAARLECSAWKLDHITPLLHDLHWLWMPQQFEFKLAVLVFHCQHGMALLYLTRELHCVADMDSQR